MPRQTPALIEPTVLTYLREHAHLSFEELAGAANVTPAAVCAWEAGTKQPTIRQARLIARRLGRPLACLYLSEPPRGFSLPNRDYRLVYGATPTVDEDLVRAVDQAHERRLAALALYDDLSEAPPAFSAIPSSPSADVFGRNLRVALGVSATMQEGWRSADKAFSGWRGAVERLGVLVFQSSRVPASVRGFSLAADVLPVIVLNRKDATVARCFTLAHELAHVARHGEGICDPLRVPVSASGAEDDVATEVFCNHAAGEVLVPAAALRAVAGAMPPTDPEVERFARHFSTSTEVIVRRLTILGLVSEEFYRRKRAEYEGARARRPGRKGRRLPVAMDVVSQVGRPFARLVLSAHRGGVLTSTDAAAHLGARLKHFPKIEALAR